MTFGNQGSVREIADEIATEALLRSGSHIQAEHVAVELVLQRPEVADARAAARLVADNYADCRAAALEFEVLDDVDGFDDLIVSVAVVTLSAFAVTRVGERWTDTVTS